ncbi:MAG: hypothetical protein ACFCUI_12940 [Bernardetiaceae bacterium]
MLAFETFFEETLRPALLPLERRRKTRIWLLRLLPVVVALMVTVVYGFEWMRLINFWQFLLISAFVGAVIVGVFWLFFSERSLPDEVEEVLQAGVPVFLGEAFTPQGGFVHYKKFADSGLFPQQVGHYTGENHFVSAGPMGNLSFSEIRAGNEIQGEWQDVFWGLFFVQECMLPAATPVLILPNRAKMGFQRTAESILGHFYDKEALQPLRLSVDQLTGYAIYAGEDKTAQSMLPPTVFDLLNEQGLDYPCHIAIKGKYAFVAIPLGNNWLQPDLSRKLTTATHVQHYYDIAQLGVSLCQEIAMPPLEVKPKSK